MLFANADQRVLGYLGRALSLEFSVVQQYSTQARLVASWGLTEAAEKLRAESLEEMEHVNRLIGRMLALGAAPNASQLRPVQLGRSLIELLLSDHAIEKEVIRLYYDATQYCAKMGDHDNRMFFEALLKEEQVHEHELAQWISELEKPASGMRPSSMERATF